jgi:transposase
MLKLPATVRVYLASAPCDMRKQFDGLATLVREGMGHDPKSGDLYVFRNRRGDMLKALFFDQQGYCLLAKRLCRGTFRVSLDGALREMSTVQMTASELGRLLSQMSFSRAHDAIDS